MIKQAKGAKGACDKLFSKIIRSKGYCESCGRTEYLQCAHIVSRRYSATRCDLRNAYSLCAGCHRRYTDWPREFSRFITKTSGSAVYDELQAQAESFLGTWDWDAELIRLKEVAAGLGVR